jgi:hypothetical protein
MGTIGCTGNLIVLLGRLLAPTNNVVHSLYLRNLALSDLLMGVYLFAIAVADQHYRGVYLHYQYSWRHSYLCNLCGRYRAISELDKHVFATRNLIKIGSLLRCVNY